jgi:hypothetical protein
MVFIPSALKVAVKTIGTAKRAVNTQITVPQANLRMVTSKTAPTTA